MSIAQFSSTPEETVISPELKEKRHVYNGETTNQKVEFPQKGNRPMKSRKRSPFNIILSLFLISILIVFYIWNKICVNRLAVEVNDLRNRHAKILNANEFLNAEINRKSSLERIVKIATEQLELTAPKEQPIWFEVDFNRAENFN